MLQECYEPFACRVAMILVDLERQGFRPRIQEAWRSLERQQALFQSGASKVKFSFHNVTGGHITRYPESLAVDIYDDDHPMKPPKRWC